MTRFVGVGPKELNFTHGVTPPDAKPEPAPLVPELVTGVVSDTIRVKAHLASKHLEVAKAGNADAYPTLKEVANTAGFPLDLGDRVVFAAATDRPLAVAGDHNGWRPSSMNKSGSVQTLEVPKQGLGKYKFVTPEGHFQADPFSRVYGYDEHGMFSSALRAGPRLERFFDIGAEGIPGRMIRIYVPGKTASHHLYAHDGHNLFDPNANPQHGGWDLHKSVQTNTMIVGIDPVDRNYEYTPAGCAMDGMNMGGADPFIDFVEAKVRDLVEGEYGKAGVRGVLGSSLGGLCALRQADRYRHNYQFVGGMSVTAWLGYDLIINTFGKNPPKDMVIYLDAGDEKNKVSVERLAKTLLESGVPRENLVYWGAKGGHNEGSWRQRAFKPAGLFARIQPRTT